LTDIAERPTLKGRRLDARDRYFSNARLRHMKHPEYGCARA
jgi:hypothetical protein